MKWGYSVLFSLGCIIAPSVANADDDLYHAVSNYLMKWKDFRFEAHEVVEQGKAQQTPRFSERHAKGVVQREKGQLRWSYTVTMSDDYKYPLPGEVSAPLNGDFILLPVKLGGSMNDNAWHRRPGSKEWKKVDANLFTLATKLANDQIFHATVMDSSLLMSAKATGTFPVFGAEANKGRKGIMYEIKDAKPAGYRYGYWIDSQTKQLLQITVANTENGESHEMTVAFWDVNKSSSPVITTPDK